MNRIEKIVYNIVKGSPTIKFFIRNTYQLLFDVLPKKRNEFSQRVSYKEGFFFGFHDVSPFSKDDSKLIACKYSIPVRMPKQDENLELGYFDLSNNGDIGDFHKLGVSYAWNYHKGCRFQWINDELLAYNTRISGRLITRIINLQGELIRELPCAIDTVSCQGDKATSFSYERLNVLMPGYGYEYCTDDGYINHNAPNESGLFLIDMKTGSKELMCSLSQLSKMFPEAEANKGKHYVTHSEFSKDGRYISFLYRWIGNDYRKRHSYLVILDMRNKSLKALPTTGMVSHYIWTPDNHIIAYCSVKEGDAHVIFDVENNVYSPILLGELNMDGHQSIISNRCFVTDTYPDKRRMSSLYMVDIDKKSKTRLAYMSSPRKYQTKDFHNHIACDLHPRVSDSGRFVCFDSVFTGIRSICVMPLNIDRK